MLLSFFSTCTKILKKEKPDCVVGTGGFVSFPVMAAAIFSKARTLIHEPNMVPGLANKVLGPFVGVITTGFTETTRYFNSRKVRVTGNPVRAEIFIKQRKKAAAHFKISALKKTLLVMPGSRAARKINRAMENAVVILNKKMPGLQILWMCGKDDYARVRRVAKKCTKIKIKVFKFIDNAPFAYSAADAGVLRAGAGTLSEIAAAGLPSILVPYPFAAGAHQEINAAAYERRGAVVVVKDGKLGPEILAEKIKETLKAQSRGRMIRALKKLAHKGSADKIMKAVYGEHK